MRKSVSIGGVFVLVLICYVLWGAAAPDYGDRVAFGTYSLSHNEETSTLVLKPDHSFKQDLSRMGKLQHAEGTWRHFGEAGIAFSKEFMVVSGQEVSADGIAYADIHKTFGLFVSLVLTDYHVVWYGRVDPSTDKAASGTYAGDERDVPATLVLKPDRTFEQTITRGGVTKHAQGSWRLNQGGDIVFSREFLKTSGDSLRDGETASVQDPQGSNLQIQIAATSKSGGPPIYRKRYLPW